MNRSKYILHAAWFCALQFILKSELNPLLYNVFAKSAQCTKSCRVKYNSNMNMKSLEKAQKPATVVKTGLAATAVS
jgi:hypothetical protein